MQFEFSNESKQAIISDGRLLSNWALKDRKVETSGGTDRCILDDDKYFGNTDFVFTHPLFCDERKPISQPSRKFYIPTKPSLLNQQAWMSFHDWADHVWVKKRDEYVGNIGHTDEMLATKKSMICDFFIGDDIAKGIALKCFEAVKTVMLIYQDPMMPEGFDVKKAIDFLVFFQRPGVRTGYFQKYNTLQQPLEKLQLNDKQLAFLQSNKSEALFQAAMNLTLFNIHELAEVKIPRFISLDGAALHDFGENIIQFKGAENSPERLQFEHDGKPIPCETVLVPRDPRMPSSQIQPGR